MLGIERSPKKLVLIQMVEKQRDPEKKYGIKSFESQPSKAKLVLSREKSFLEFYFENLELLTLKYPLSKNQKLTNFYIDG